MAEDISNKELYRIINRAIAKWGEFDNLPADKEISIFCRKYDMRRKNNPQIDIFEDNLPSPEDVAIAKQMCSDIQEYRDAVDIYEDKEGDIELSEDFYRRLYRGIERYSAHISKENQIRYKILRQTVQSHLPEMKDIILLNQYNREIDFIEYLRKKKNPECSKRASDFCKQIALKNGELKNTVKEAEASPEKLYFCEKCVKVVDCLPQDKYTRSTKYAFKRNLYNLMGATAKALGPVYEKTAQMAENEAARYQKAIENTQNYFQKPRKRRFSEEEMKRRAFEEWWCK